MEPVPERRVSHEDSIHVRRCVTIKLGVLLTQTCLLTNAHPELQRRTVAQNALGYTRKN